MLNFLNPLFLWAAAAALVPLILHLMQRRRIVRVEISTVRFLKLAQKRSSTRVRMENFLLWLLRTLLMLVLTAAFALPVIRTQSLGRFLGSSRRDIAIVLDVSYSMGYESGRRNVWDTARAAAVAAIESLRPGDRVCAFLADEHCTPLIEQPSEDRALVANLIRNLEWRATASQLHEAAGAAVAALAESGYKEREVYIITDGQALPWRGFQSGMQSNAAARVAAAPAAGSNGPPAAPAAVTGAAPVTLVTAGESNAPPAGPWNPTKIDRKIAFFALLAGPRQPENTYPFHMGVDNPYLLADKPAKVSARIAHTGPAQNLAVSLYVDDAEIHRQNAPLDENGEVGVTFNVPALPVGTHAARIATSTDGLPLDDDFHFLLRVYKQLPVLVIGAEEDSFFLMTALQPGGEAASAMGAKRIEPDGLPGEILRNYSTVFLCNALPLSGQAILALEDYVRSGGVLVLFPGDNASPRQYEEWTCLPAKPVAIDELPAADRVRPLRLLAGQDPLFTGFTLPPGAIPTVALQRYLRWEFPDDTEAVPVIGAGAETPFLLSRNVGRGRVLFFAVSADRRWSSLPILSVFLPLVHQIVQFGAGMGKEPLYVWTGRHMVLTDILPDLKEGDQVFTPRGDLLAVRPIRKGARVLLEAEHVAEAGVYSLARSGDAAVKELLLAANIPRLESSLEPVDGNGIPALIGIRDIRVARDVPQLQELIEEHRRGRPLTEACLWIALALAIGEVFLANRVSRRRESLSDRMRVALSGRVTAVKT
jgi:hypothetical protein